MPQLSLLGIAPQRILNTIVAAFLLFITPVLAPASLVAPLHALVTLNYSAAADQLAEQLSHPLTFSDRMGTALFAHLATPLDLQQALTANAYHAGDLAYVPDEQAVVIFLVDGSAVPDDGLIILGDLTTGFGDLAGCTRDCPIDLMVAPAS